MTDVEAESVPVIAVTAAVGAVVLLLVLLCNVGKKQENEEQEEKDVKETKSNAQAAKKQNGAGKKQRFEKKKESKQAFSHPWLVCSLRGHSAPITGVDFSLNGKYVVTSAEDRAVLIWNTKDFNSKERKSVRANVEYDHATKVKFSPDNKAFLVSLFRDNTIRVMKIGKKADGSMGNIQGVLDFPKSHKQEIVNIGISSNGKFIMSASRDTQIKIWDLKGEMISSIDTHQVNNAHAEVSPCGRFVASSGFTSDVKVWEVVYDKSGTFKEVTRAFELKGHTAGVYHFSFSQGSNRMASVSKDGTWKLWDTDIEYQKGQEPYLLQTGKCSGSGHSVISISPDARTVAVVTGSTLSVYNTTTAECTQTMSDVFSGPAVALSFDTTSRYLACAGDKQVLVFHNVTGYQATIVDLQQKKKKATNSAYKDRLQQQIEEAKSLLASVKAAA